MFYGYLYVYSVISHFRLWDGIIVIKVYYLKPMEAMENSYPCARA